MSLQLTPAMLVTAYEFFRTTKPYKRWKLPHSDVVEFHITRHVDRHGDCSDVKGGPRIRISSRTTFWTDKFLKTMAHEMIHLHLHRIDGRLKHGPEFKRCALEVCTYHGFDPKQF